MRSWIKKVFGFGLASLLCDLSHEMTISLIPVLVAQLVGAGSVPLFLGMIASVSDAFASLLRLVAGFLTDRLPRKRPLIMLGYGITALFGTLVGYAQSVWQLFLCRIFSFVGSGLREPPRDALIATIIEPAKYGRAFGLRNAMDTVGSLIGPLVAFICLGSLSVRQIFTLSLLPGVLAVGAVWALTDDVPVYQRASHVSATLWHDLMLLPRAFIVWLGILTIFDLGCFNKLLLLSRAQEVLSPVHGTAASWLVLLYALFNGVRACSELVIGWLSDYVNRILLLALLGCGSFTLVAWLLIAPPVSLGYFFGIFALAGVSAASMLTLKKACAADMLPPAIRGLGYGMLQATEGLAALFSSSFIGLLWVNYSALVSFSYAMGLSMVALVLLLLFARWQQSKVSFPHAIR